MKFSIVFKNSGDEIPFNVIYNHDLFEFFIDKVKEKQQNSFTDDQEVSKLVDKRITHLHWAISKTNEVLYDLIEQNFAQHTDLENYLDQHFLNKTHSDWVFSHYNNVDIDKLRYSKNINQAKIGNILHENYPDDICAITTAPAMEKLGYIYPFREVNMGVHRLESSFSNIEFKSELKWEVFENPFVDSLISNNDIVNFSFGYTYVGRQYYNKFRFFDLKLENPDHYNFETLEFAFQINLKKPETIPFSKEFVQWTQEKNIKCISEQVPIANIPDINENLFEYRKILYRNSRNNNRAELIVH